VRPLRQRHVAANGADERIHTLVPPDRSATSVRDFLFGAYSGLRLAGYGINGGLRRMSDLETPEAGMMRDHSSLAAAPATLRLEESQPDLDPNNPGVAPDTALLSGSRGRETDLRGHGAAGT